MLQQIDVFKPTRGQGAGGTVVFMLKLALNFSTWGLNFSK